MAPLPFERHPEELVQMRTWQFARALAEAGREVRVTAVVLDEAYVAPPVALETVDGVRIERIPKTLFVDPGHYRSSRRVFARGR